MFQEKAPGFMAPFQFSLAASLRDWSSVVRQAEEMITPSIKAQQLGVARIL